MCTGAFWIHAGWRLEAGGKHCQQTSDFKDKELTFNDLFRLYTRLQIRRASIWRASPGCVNYRELIIYYRVQTARDFNCFYELLMPPRVCSLETLAEGDSSSTIFHSGCTQPTMHSRQPHNVKVSTKITSRHMFDHVLQKTTRPIRFSVFHEYVHEKARIDNWKPTWPRTRRRRVGKGNKTVYVNGNY